MRQRLGIARTLVHDPAVLLLDEPAAGLDPQGRGELRTLIGELQQLGKTVLISSHLLTELEQLCTEIAILDQGRLLAFGNPRDVQRVVESSRRVRVVFRGGLVNEYVVRDDAEQEALLHRLLVDEQRPVIECKAVSALEDLFLHMTRRETPAAGDDLP
jgi:ABC-2 type transport system ATP-binding protein